MAVNFGDTIMEGGIEPSVKVQNPVEDNSGAVLANALAPAAQAIGQIGGTVFRQSQEDGTARIMSRFRNELYDYADAVDQGRMTPQEAQIRARASLRQYEANAPALYDDFAGVWADFTDASGLGNVLRTGTNEQQREMEFENSAYAAGFNSTEAYRQSLVDGQAVVESTRRLTLLQNQGATITQTQMNQHLSTITAWADNAFPVAQRQVNEAMAAIQANPNNKAEIVENLNFTLGSTIAQVQQMGGPADSSYITKPIEQLMETFNGFANGSVSNTVLEGQLKNTQLTYDLMYATDPSYGPRIAASRMLSQVGLETLGINLWDADSIKTLVDLNNPDTPPPNLLDESEASQRTVENVAAIAGAITPTSSPELITETRTSIEGIIDSMYTHERSASNGAMSYKDVVNNLGRPEIAEFISTHGISPKHAQQAADILGQVYEQELIPVINREWSNVAYSEPRTVAGLNVIPRGELVEPKWNGNALEFVPTQEYANDPTAQRIASQLNTGDNSIAVPLNGLINTYSVLTGVDAKTIYEQDFAQRLFGAGEGANAPEGEVMTEMSVDPAEAETAPPFQFNTPEDLTTTPSPADLTIEDFQPDELEAVVMQTSAAEPQALLTADNPVGVAQAYLGRSEENAEDVDVLSSFISRTAGLVINPAQTAWCAAFVDAILHQSGQGGGTGKLNARSYLNWGVKVDQPRVGDVVVMYRGDPNGWQGHVGFYAGTNADGTIKVLGGNQGNAVSFSDYNPETVLGYRRAG